MSLEEAGQRRGGEARGGGRGAALLFDHVLVDHSRDDGQRDDVPGRGQDLCDLFVLQSRQASGHPGAQRQLCGGVGVVPARGRRCHPTAGVGRPSGKSPGQTCRRGSAGARNRPLPEDPRGRGSMPLPTLTLGAGPSGLACNGALQGHCPPSLPRSGPRISPGPIFHPIALAHHTGVRAPKQEENHQAAGDIGGTLHPPGPCRPASLN